MHLELVKVVAQDRLYLTTGGWIWETAGLVVVWGGWWWVKVVV
jgi:hypothetical protein